MADLQINWAIIAPIIVLQLILMVAAIWSLRKEETKGPKWLWVFIIIIINILGPILYFVVGRKND